MIRRLLALGGLLCLIPLLLFTTGYSPPATAAETLPAPPSSQVTTTSSLPPTTTLPTVTTSQPIGQILFDGDSMTYGSEATAPYPTQLMRLASSDLKWRNLAKGGRRIQDMLADAPAKVDPLYDPSLGRNVVVVWGGTNDLALWSHMPRAVWERMQKYCLDRRAQGFAVVVLTMLPRSDRGCTPGFEERREAVNRRIRLSWSEIADVLVDVAADPRIGPSGAERDLRYYVPGAVHLNNRGLAIVAQLVLEGLAKLQGTGAPL